MLLVAGLRKYWSDLGKMRVHRGWFPSCPSAQLCKGCLPSCCIGCRSAWGESSSFNVHLNPSVTPCAPGSCSFPARAADSQPCRVCARREAGGTGPGPLCNPRPELSFEIFTIPGSEWERFGWVFGMCSVMEMWDCAELCPVVTLGRAPQSCAGMTYL